MYLLNNIFRYKLTLTSSKLVANITFVTVHSYLSDVNSRVVKLCICVHKFVIENRIKTRYAQRASPTLVSAALAV